MPKEKKYKSTIAAIYKRRYEDIGMFYFIEGQRYVVPMVTIEQAIENFFRYMGIREFNADSAMTTYSRMKKEYFDSQKEEQ